MKEKIDAKNLFVGCLVEKYDHLIEPFVQYETFGKEFHAIRITPKRRLIMRVNQNDEEIFVDVLTGKSFKPVQYESSYYTESSALGTVYGYFLTGYNTGIRSLNSELKQRFEDETHRIGYLIPFDEYMRGTLNMDIDQISISHARMLVNLTNLTQPKPFFLSEDKKTAEEQLQSKVYRKK